MSIIKFIYNKNFKKMCGIYCAIGKYLQEMSMKIKSRGPDNTILKNYDNLISLVFHRLIINGLNKESSNQPFEYLDGNLIVACNGEIYNYKELAIKYDIELETGSDCEIIGKLFIKLKYDVELLLNELLGEFAIIIIDRKEKSIYACRDPFGVRPLFMGLDSDKNVVFSSEMKAIDENKYVIPVEPGYYTKVSYNGSISSRMWYNMNIRDLNVKQELIDAVKRRVVNSDRKVGFLLSGGLDSSLVVGIAAKLFPEKEIYTFSIGLEGSPDLEYAEKVAKYINSNHHSVIVTREEMINAIPEVIRCIESYDVTTVRASVPNYLLAKYISKNTDIKVLLSGEGSDEMGGYLYFKKAPNRDAFDDECKQRLEEIHIFDVLRADRCISNWGLEARVPFLDKRFVEGYMNIRRYGDKNELRNMFDGYGLIPSDVLWRKKEAFSDGISKKEDSWHNIIKKIYPNESESYKDIFMECKYPKCYISDRKWMPKWTNNNSDDPSYREWGDELDLC